jgi:hypothetical protein
MESEALDAESQGVRSLVSRWTELSIKDKIFIRLLLGKTQVVLPYR